MRNSRRFRRAALASVAWAALGAAGCNTSTAPLPTVQYNRPVQTSDVASVHLAAISVIPWVNISAELQPAFSMDTATALQKALETTSNVKNTATTSNEIGVAANLAGPSIDKSTTTSVANGVTTSSSGAKTELKTPAVPDATAPTGTAAVGGGPSAATGGLGQTAATEAILNYQVATALYQEVKILNHYVEGIVAPPGYVAYLVRLQIAVLPLVRNIPYDTTIDLDFSMPNCPANQSGNCIKVVPLLVTDSLENLNEDWTQARSSGLSAKVGGSSGIFGGAFSGSHQSGRTAQTQAGRPNSLFAVGKLNDHALRVRLGANRFGDTFEMIPRNHTVSVVVYTLDPSVTGASTVGVSGQVYYRDATALTTSAGGAPVQGVLEPERFTLPDFYPDACPPAQTVIFSDDGVTMTASIGNSSGLGQRKILGVLQLPSVPMRDDRVFTLQASEARVDKDNIVLKFPSVSKLIGKGGAAPIVGNLLFSYSVATRKNGNHGDPQPALGQTPCPTKRGDYVAWLTSGGGASQLGASGGPAGPPPVVVGASAPKRLTRKSATPQRHAAARAYAPRHAAAPPLGGAAYPGAPLPKLTEAAPPPPFGPDPAQILPRGKNSAAGPPPPS